MARSTVELVIRTSKPLTLGQMVAGIRLTLTKMGIDGGLVFQGTEIKVVGEMPSHMLTLLPLEQTDDRVELISVEAEPMGGPRH